MGNMSSISAVRFGAFACGRLTTTAVTKTRWTVRCYLAGGAGTNLAFSVTSCQSLRCYTSASSNFLVSYPAPTLRAHSLRLYATPNNKTTSLQMTTTLSTLIALDGQQYLLRALLA